MLERNPQFLLLNELVEKNTILKTIEYQTNNSVFESCNKMAF